MSRWLTRIGVLFLGAGLVVLVFWPSRSGTRTATLPKASLIWTFEPIQRGGIIARPKVHQQYLYCSLVRDAGLGVTSGAVYCLDRWTGQPCWEFDDGRRMLHTISSPTIQADRLYVGEGMHGDLGCKLYCLDARTGTKHWSRAFGGHLESTPLLHQDLVFITAGDDGLHAVETKLGVSRWGHRGSGHLDAAPLVRDGRLIGGSGVSQQFRTSEIFCLDILTGQPYWRVPTPLPAWATPVGDEQGLFVALGNGRLISSEPPPGIPAGALLRLDPRDGATLWRTDFVDSILARPALDAECVYVVCRDGWCYAVERLKGAIRWRHALDSPLVAEPELLQGRLYVVSTDGLLVCLEAASGTRLWEYDLAEFSTATPRVLAGPVVARGQNGSHWVYLGTELRSPAGGAALLFCLEEPLGVRQR